MAKKKRPKNKKKSVAPICLIHGLWPELEKLLGHDCCFYIDEHTGEVIVHTGFRSLENLEVVEGDPMHWARVRCTCGNEGDVRVDLLHQGKVHGCPNCMAADAALKRN